MGKGGYNGGGTVVGPRSGWFSFKGGPPKRKTLPAGRDRTAEEEAADFRLGQALAAKREKRGEEMLQHSLRAERKKARRLEKLAKAAAVSPFKPLRAKVPIASGVTSITIKKKHLSVAVVVLKKNPARTAVATNRPLQRGRGPSDCRLPEDTPSRS